MSRNHPDNPMVTASVDGQTPADDGFLVRNHGIAAEQSGSDLGSFFLPFYVLVGEMRNCHSMLFKLACVTHNN
ncbi:MAG: hypothetical protein H7834_16340 [Magnetococcus sp. YQC-9]